MLQKAEQKRSIFSTVHPLEALALLGLFGALLMYIASVLSVYQIPYGLDFGEGYLASMSFEFFLGNNPYHSLDQPPWIVSSYPPLFPAINGLIMSITGPSLIPGRFIATASLVGILAVAVLLMRRMKIDLTAAILMAGMLLVFPWAYRWSQVVRVDTFGILLTITGIYFWVRSEKPAYGIVAAIFFAAGALTKQSLLVAPAACLIYAFLSRDTRRFTLLILLVVLIGGTYGVLNVLTGGGLFEHLFSYTANAWFLTRFTAGTGEYFKATWILHIFAISGLLMPGAVYGHRRILGWYYLLAHLALITYGFEGSDSNYCIEPLLALSLLSGLAVDRMIEPGESVKQDKTRLPSTRTIAFALILVVIILARYMNTADYEIHRMNTERLENGKRLLSLVGSAPDPILSEDASFTFITGKTVIFQPYIMSLLTRTGKWDQSEFVSTIEGKEYSLIILRVDLTDPYNTEVEAPDLEMAGFNRWTSEMEEAILENYYVLDRLDVGTRLNSSRPLGVEHRFYIYLPKGSLPNPPPPTL